LTNLTTFATHVSWHRESHWSSAKSSSHLRIMIGRNAIQVARNAGRLQFHTRPVATARVSARHLQSSSIRRNVTQADVSQTEEPALKAHFGGSFNSIQLSSYPDTDLSSRSSKPYNPSDLHSVPLQPLLSSNPRRLASQPASSQLLSLLFQPEGLVRISTTRTQYQKVRAVRFRGGREEGGRGDDAGSAT